jgi:hypothetical protein
MLLAYVPKHRIDDVVYFAPFDQEFPVALNVMEDIGPDKRALVASGLIGAFKKVWVDAWSPRMEYILNNALLALLETPGSTLLGVNRMFADKSFRDSIVANVTDPAVRAFWLDEYAKYSDRFATEATAAIQNKVGQFVANPLIRNMIGQPKSTFDIRKLMDDRKIFIVNLSKGRIGEGNANLIGSMLITKIYLAAMSRAEIHPTELHKLPAFYLYVDEFQSFANESFADILSEARKYKLALTIAHQYIEQMSEEVRAAVFGNVGTMISFRVGSYDAEVLEKEFAPQFTAQDIVNLGFAQVYLKLMINGVGSPPFSATTLPRPVIPEPNYVREITDRSREQFGRPRASIEEEIKKWHEPVAGSEDPSIPKTRKFSPMERSAPLRPPQRERSEMASPEPQRFIRSDIRPPIQRQRREEPVHQPFATELTRVMREPSGEERLDDDRETEAPAPRPAVPAVAPKEERKPSIAEVQASLKPIPQERPNTVPLSSLNMNNRKDKGATEEKLSDLRAVLQKVMVAHSSQPPVTEQPKTVKVAESDPSPTNVSNQRFIRPPEPKPEAIGSFHKSENVPVPAQPKEQPPAPMKQETPAGPQSRSEVSRRSIPLVPESTVGYGVLPEIPEDVLRRVLRVD